MKTKTLLPILLFLFVQNSLFAQVPKKTDGVAMKAIVTEIASDQFKGRKTGTDEGRKTEEYFVSEFKKLGLQPAGESGTYFHTFTYSDYEVNKAELVINDRVFLMGYDLDFDVMYYSDKGEAKGEIVFAGYGIACTDKKRNDFDSIDIKDKIVLIRRGCPDNNFDKWGAAAIDSVKALYCYKQGAKGVLFFSPINYNNKQLNTINNWIASVEKIKDFPIFYIRDYVAKYILSSTKQTYNRMLRAIDNKTISFNTGKTISMKADVADIKGQARNVLAMIPGTDPKLKKEFIIIGGHMDHIGVNANNEIRNGADDNASGVAVTLGIAQAMVKNKLKPKRTIVFACWTGEEMGLLGSNAWCKKPTLDIYKTVVYFNLDMIGLGDGKLDMPGTLYAPEVTAFIKENIDTLTLKKINWQEGGLGGSDHNGFLTQGIPAFAGMTSGEHPDYHQPADDADKIKSDILQFVGDFIYHSTEKLAMSKQNFISESRFEQNRSLIKKLRDLTPIPYSSFIEAIEKSKSNIAIVDLSKGLKDNNPEQNFLSILKNFDESAKKAQESGKVAYNLTAYEAISATWWSDQTSALAAFNFNTIGYNELYTKVLSKYGFRIGLIDEEFANYGDTTIRNSFINCVNDQNIGFLLDNQDLNKMHFLLEKSKRPVMILCKTNALADNNVIKTIETKEHFVVFQVNSKNSVADLINIYNSYKEKIGQSNFAFTVDPDDIKSGETLKKLLTELEKNLSENDYYGLTEDNFNRFVSKSLQDYPIKFLWR